MPAVLNTIGPLVAPGAIVPVSNWNALEASDVAVCGALSMFIQVTLVPTATVKLPNAKPAIVPCAVMGVVAGVGVGVVTGVGVVAGVGVP